MANLHIIDWVIIALFLAGTLAIGIFYAIRGNRTTSDYLTGDRNLQLFPVAVSMTASLYSSILVLGFPAEVYTNGGMYWLYTIGSALAVIYTIIVFVPVFYPLGLTSVNEFLHLRYKSRFVAILGMLQSIVSLNLHTGIVYFGPATALNASTDLPVWAGIVICGAVTCIYTTIGGIKAVIWTDVFQALLMVVSLLAVCIQAVIQVGSFGRMMEICEKGNRLDFTEFSTDPTIRFTFWSLSIGAMFVDINRYGVTQPSVQRYCSLASITKARICVVSVIPFVFFMVSLTIISGLSMFAYYEDIGCDPLRAGIISNANQLVPHFVIYILRQPGFAGILFAGLISSSLSTASSNLNSCAANIWDDLIRPVWPNLSVKQNVVATKAIVVFFGLMSTGITFIVSQVGGTLIQMIVTFNAACGGPTSALFTMGIFLPFANWIGATSGGFAGFIFAMWLGFGSYSINKQKDYLPSTVSNCSAYAKDILGDISQYTGVSLTNALSSNIAPTLETGFDEHPLKEFYSVSYFWVAFFSFLVTLTVGVIVSLLSGGKRGEELNRQTIHPWIRKFFIRAEKKSTKNKNIPKEMPERSTYAYDNPVVRDSAYGAENGSKLTNSENETKSTYL